MTMQIALRLDDEQVKQLDHLVISWDDLQNRSDAIRIAIQEFVDRRTRSEIDRQIVEGYTRFPQGGANDVDDWGDLIAQSLEGTEAALAALDAEDGGW
jgi:Arc/MetJ-type ribon-helix-helix transcriptional regulator